MKKTFLLLALTITASIANTNTSKSLTASQSIEILTKGQTVIREVRNSREIPKKREIRKNRVLKIEKITSFPIARVSREIRKNRFIVQTTRESREMRNLFIQNKSHFANLK